MQASEYECLEGWLIEAIIGGISVIFLVKGYEHPDGMLITLPYRCGQHRIEEPLSWMRLVAPWSLRRPYCMPRKVPLIPISRIVKCIDPHRALKERLQSFPSPVREVIYAIDAEWIGLTGSWALGAEMPGSDVDLLLYGRSVYDSLVELHRAGILRPCGPRYDRIRQDEDTTFLYGVKIVESCAGTYRITFRILRSLVRMPCRKRIPLGRIKTVIKLVDVGEAHLVPARYKVKEVSVIKGVRNSVILETWRTRYQELPQGVYELEGEAWIEEDYIIVSPDIGGYLAPKAW